jgi:hypothetical protein
MVKKWCGSPCDRRIDRRKVFVTATAVLLLACTAQAGITDFLMDDVVSSLTVSGNVHGNGANPSIGGSVFPFAASPDQAGSGANSLVSYFGGHLYSNVNTGVSLTPIVTGAGYQRGLGSATAPTGPDRDGVFIPGDVNGTPTTGGPIPGYPVTPFADFGSLGISIPAIGAFARFWGNSIGPSAYAAGAMPFVGGTSYAVAPQIWAHLGGYEDFVSGLGGDHVVLGSDFGGGPFPLPLSGTFDATNTALIGNGGNPVYSPGAGVATWDGVTLTINVSGTLKYTIEDNNTPANGADDIDIVQTFNGQLVYHPYVPEPSSMVLAGCGVVGLLAAVWRRKRQPIVA